MSESVRQPDWVSECGRVRLYRGDVRDVLPALPPLCADATVTDPPYGVREEYWDALPPHEFGRLTMAWLAEAARLSRELVAFCFAGDTIHRLSEMAYKRVRPMVWFKPPGSQYAGASERGLWFSHESILHCYDDVWQPKSREVAEHICDARERAGLSRGGVDIAVRGKRTGLCYRWEEGACLPTREQVAILRPLLHLNETFDAALERAYAERRAGAEGYDVFVHRTVVGAVHPCEKPVGLMVDLLRSLGSEWHTVLDPFMGSGSTGVACVETGRQFIGVERDETHFATARARIEKALREQAERLPLATEAA